jgi:hypothetical protein
MDWHRVNVVCFSASYGVAWLAELLRLWKPRLETFATDRHNFHGSGAAGTFALPRGALVTPAWRSPVVVVAGLDSCLFWVCMVQCITGGLRGPFLCCLWCWV